MADQAVEIIAFVRDGTWEIRADENVEQKADQDESERVADDTAR